MKCAILLAFAAFAFLAQAEAQGSFELGPVYRGPIIQALKERLRIAKEKLDSMVDKALNALQDKFTKATEKAKHLIEQLKVKAHQISDKISAIAQKILGKLDADVNAILPSTRSHSPIEGISECMIMKDTVRLAVMALIANTSSCVNDKIDQAESYVVDMYVRSKLAVEKIRALKDQGDECIRNITGIAQISSGIVCVVKATASGSMVVAKTIPTVTLDFAKLTFKISTLPIAVPSCISTKALGTLGQEAKDIAVSIKDCIKEKVQGQKEMENITQEEINEVINIANEAPKMHSSMQQPNIDE